MKNLQYVNCLFEVETISPCQVPVDHLGYLYVAHYCPAKVEELQRQIDMVVPTMYGAKRFLQIEKQFLEEKMRKLNGLIEKYGGRDDIPVDGFTPSWPVSAKRVAKRARGYQYPTSGVVAAQQVAQQPAPQVAAPQPPQAQEGEISNKLFITLTDRTIATATIRGAMTHLSGLNDIHLVPDAPPSTLLKGFGFLTFDTADQASTARGWFRNRGCPVVRDARFPIDKRPASESPQPELPQTKWPRLV